MNKLKSAAKITEERARILFFALNSIGVDIVDV